MQLLLRAGLTFSLAILGPSVAGAATWQPASTVAPNSPAGVGVGFDIGDSAVQTARDVRGDVAVAWTRQDPPFQQGVAHVQVSVKLVGRPWSAPEDVAAGSSRLTNVTMDGKGDLTVSFLAGTPGAFAPGAIRTRRSDGTWDVPFAGPSGAGIGQVEADGAGDLLAMVPDPGSTEPGTFATIFRPAGGHWGAPVVLTQATYGGLRSAIEFEMGANGMATMVQTGGTELGDIFTRRFTPALGWSEAAPLVSYPSQLLSLMTELAVSVHGGATLAVQLPDGTIVSSERTAAAAAWTPLASIGNPGTQCRPVSLAVDAADGALIGCVRPNDVGASRTLPRSSALIASRGADGVWGPLVDVEDSLLNDGGYPIQLVMTDDGRSLAGVYGPPISVVDEAGPVLLERRSGSPWASIALPFADGFDRLYGGGGNEVMALEQFGDNQAGQVTTGLAAALLQELPTASKAPVSTSRVTVRLAGTRTCASVAHPCRTGRVVHLTVGTPSSKGSLGVTISRRRSGTWRKLRTVRVPIHGLTGRASLRLPRGHVRISATALHDTHAHPWAVYLLVV